MTYYAIYHRLSDLYCTNDTPWNKECFAKQTSHIPNIFNTLKAAKMAMSRGINDAKKHIALYAERSWTDDEEYHDRLQFLSGTEIIAIELAIKPDKVVYSAITKIGAKNGK